jgi:hypothetical protein
MMSQYSINHSVSSTQRYWSLVKNGVRGVYHAVGISYLQSYLDEYTSAVGYAAHVHQFLKQVEKRDVVIRQTPAIVVEPF